MIGVLGTVLGWTVVVLAGTATLSIAAGWCPRSPVAMAQLLLPWWFVLTVVTVTASIVAGTAVLPIVGTLVAAGAFAVLLPKTKRSRRRSRPEGQGVPCRVVLANLYIDNDEADETIAQLLESRPDVLVMTELTPELVARFDRLGGAERFPHRVHHDPIEGEYVVGIFTALDVEESGVSQRGELEVVESAVRLDGGGALRVIAVHPEAPVGADAFRRWRHQLRELRSVLAEATGPTIALGDLNSGTLQPPYERLLATRFRDAHDLMGTALHPSWGVAPWFPRWFPTLVARLDHLLVSPEIVVERLDDLDPVGSDHRPFRADLSVHPSR